MRDLCAVCSWCALLVAQVPLGCASAGSVTEPQVDASMEGASHMGRSDSAHVDALADAAHAVACGTGTKLCDDD